MIDLRDLPVADRRGAVRERASAESRRRFELASDRLWDAQLFLIAEGESYLWVNFHHSIIDGWSVGVFFRDFGEFYGAACEGRGPVLPPLPVQYGDFAAWQREHVTTTEFQGQLERWKDALRLPLAPVDLPFSKPRPPAQTFRGATHTFTVPRDLVAAADDLAAREASSRFLVGLATFQTLIHRYTGQTDLLIGVPVANRQRPETRDTVGFFTNTLVFRTDLSGDPTVREVLARARRTRTEAFAGSDVDLEALVGAVQPPHDASRQPFFQVVFQYQNIPIVPERIGPLGAENVPVHNGTAMFDLRMGLEDTPDGGLSIWIEYNTALFDAAAIERLGNHYLILLAAACAEPDTAVGELPLMTPTERHQIVREWNATAGDYPRDLCIHNLFEARARQQPDAVAVVAGGREVTYRELNERANRLARYLRAQGVAPGTFVGVCLRRAVEPLVAVLGILKAGGAYVPLDPVYPRDRIAFMLGDSRAPLVVTERALLDRLPGGETRCVCVEQIAPGLAPLDPGDLDPVSGPGDVCYVIYTSGSTGRPKGVVLRHTAVVNVLDWVNATFEVGPRDRLLFVTSLSFDLSVYDVFGVLGAGGSVRVAAEDELRDPARLARVLRTEGITIWDSAPAALQQLAPFFERDRRDRLRLVMLSGDWIPVALPDQVRAAFPGASVVSLGGATEAAIWSNWYPIGPVDPAWPSIPYGRPIRNARYHVLDSRLQPVPVGVPGELHIGGLVLADGYLNRPELTAERFVPDPLTPRSPGSDPADTHRLYKTGDLARYMPDGNIEFLGRIDQQVKVRGFRVELGEIEAVLAAHPAVRECVVKHHRDAANTAYLAAYVVAQPGADPGADELAGFLRATLPEYMVPAHFVALAALPVTPNGKLDRAALAPPDLAAARPEAAFESPANDAERALLPLWEELLNVRPISVTDSFRDLGGNSLSAAVLMARVESRLGHRVPLEALFAAPTVRGLAAVIQRKLELGRGCLVPLQPGGGRPPLFLIAGAGGHVFAFHQFARHLGPDQPTYGLKAVGVDGTEPPLESMAEIAARYLKEIVAARPDGPYVVGGYSIGAVIALELAVQLRAAGKKVPHVIVFDMLAPGYPRKPSPVRRAWRHLVRFARAPGRLSYLRDRFRRVRGRVLGALNLHWLDAPGVPGMDLVPQENLKRVWGALTKARDRYWPSGTFDGRVILFASETPEDWPGCVFDDPMKGWGRWATGGVERHVVPAGHLDIFREDNQELVAGLLRVAIGDPA
ncbi:amino acid adenylation domain protein : Amino acid adenylation domain protein OS=Chroococcidiopsis thermalis PCC 7203 GN=Chro_0078 PE=4 SV=1: Condensation: HxxPF_rpt: AMP-binding: AMP-binding_C: PP-binding: Thioesterase [Gemmataceae bacterium]|nr:amino acid adenylation domain protein : Amino acid adenylation domain protein OS=Chroococcidiopsis thermalis PCC 7203 GN=Chro_0078 PE=4 SV=1: Condensation: HxxPF_rpt: AMP-binding: AMP-binding_C: PP-binding: Thioesterase [Gemmataceae bacterium]VTT99453.1 amino acid adenylation domain protein : Amino acid adenylation domain protein OS=Chroococcidiopsis thermalis PCC 7203 GN=Chro_0078 PE=4 SV=1: Condensation: HxxPF_rpt: AMP-binding: AMP-binding_C: PP-binding: Thioesterase [Gemmataceae bacterium]